jgi:hypothetical protein
VRPCVPTLVLPKQKQTLKKKRHKNKKREKKKERKKWSIYSSEE